MVRPKVGGAPKEVIILNYIANDRFALPVVRSL